MVPTAANPSATPLQHQLAEAGEEARQLLSRENVSTIIKAVLGSLEGNASGVDLTIYRELEALARYIHHARREIAAIGPDDLNAQHIQSATDELDAVVGATEDATNRIMDVCDEIGAIAARVDQENGAALNAAVTSIFEACNFQDITGQRITKVVRTLKHIENKIEALVQVMGEEVQKTRQGDPSAQAEADPNDESTLLNGPQLPGAAIDQNEIDRLLSGF
jgi:chemotaxis protein CheZ